MASGRPLEWNCFLTTSCELWKERTIWKSQSGNVGAAELAVVLVQAFIFSKKFGEAETMMMRSPFFRLSRIISNAPERKKVFSLSSRPEMNCFPVACSFSLLQPLKKHDRMASFVCCAEVSPILRSTTCHAMAGSMHQKRLPPANRRNMGNVSRLVSVPSKSVRIRICRMVIGLYLC